MARTYLIVDDSLNATHTTRELLEQQGEDPADITVTHTALDALRRVREQSFDVILLDIDLPDMGGHELAKDLREEAPEIRGRGADRVERGG
jgi:CheY-like chemotaxis protein